MARGPCVLYIEVFFRDELVDNYISLKYPRQKHVCENHKKT